MENKESIPLADLLRHISTELRKAHEAAMADTTAVMRFKECELEFAVEAELKAGGGLNIYVLKLGGGAKRTEKNTIKIKYAALEEQELVAQVLAPSGTRKKPTREGKKVK